MATHYQTCFYIRYAPGISSRYTVFQSMQNRIRQWICEKEKVVKTLNKEAELKKDFLRQTTYIFPSKNTCVTECHRESLEETATVDMWAVRYTEFKKKQNWITEIGLRRIDGETCLVHVKISYNLGRYAMGSQEAPSPSVPRFVKELLADGRHLVFLANEKGASIIPMQSGCLSVSSEREVSFLFDRLIQSYLRRYVIVVCNGDYKAENEAKRLYQGLLGKALVIYLNKCDAVKSALEDLPIEYRVPFNHVRIFYPVEGSRFDKTISCDAMDLNRCDVVANLLAAFILDNGEAIKTPESVKHFNALSLAHEQMRKNEEARNSDDEVDKKVQELTTFIDELCKEVDEIKAKHQEELAKQELEVERYKKRVGTLNDTIEEKKRELSAAYNQNKALASLDYPGSLAGIMLFFANLFPQRLIIHEEAIESAQKYTYFKEFSRAWELMSALSTTLYEMKYEEEDGMINETVFENITGYQITMAESRMTSRDTNLANQRKREYKGTVYDVSPHLKWGSKPPKCLRLHFAFVEEEKKILIGYFGEHLDNYSTRKLKG